MILGLGHVAYRINDIDASLAFYCDKLGLTEAFRMNNDQGYVWIIYVRLNADNFLELFPGGENAVEMPPRPIGYAHLCLRVDNLDATIAELASRGIEVDNIRKGKSGCLQGWVTDPDGNRIELMEILPDSLQATR
ncbi:MAG: VOC family protein [Candidatus Poribacteria bacterium]|nr:VOC family protein [Candidatus Poribacteria bacterium]